MVPNRSDSSDWRSSSATNEQGIELRRGSSPSEWQSAALARRAEATTAVVTPPQHWKDVEWQQLWLATQRRRWRSLALVPAGEMPPDFTLDIAVGLVQTGSLHLGMPIRVADATQVPLAHLMQFTSELDAVVAAGDLVLVALGPVRSNPTTVSLAQSSDCALLCVPLGSSRVSDAKRTVAEIGAQRFLGSAVFRL